MTDFGETVENLARRLERLIILDDLKDCKTSDDFQNLVQKYENLCSDDNKN